MIAKQRVLVVDDEKIVRESFRRALTAAGYSVSTAASGHDALQACRDERCDVMLADLKMPDMDGLQVTREVNREFPDLPVVIVTGYPSSETYREAAELGIVDYLEKPISPERLSAATATALAHPPHSRTPLAEALRSRLAVESPAGSSPETETETGRSAEVETRTDDSADTVAWVPEPATAVGAVFETDEQSAGDVSTLKAMGLLALSPLLGLAFVVFLPLIGFGMLFAALGSVLTDRSSWARR